MTTASGSLAFLVFALSHQLAAPQATCCTPGYGAAGGLWAPVKSEVLESSAGAAPLSFCSRLGPCAVPAGP